MNQWKYAPFLILTLTLVTCNGIEKKENTPMSEPQTEVSGTIQDGYRILPIKLDGNPATYTIYRGDYVKFLLDDGDNPQTDYHFQVPDLAVNTTLSDTIVALPFFKMKVPGEYPFTLGNVTGVFNVIELEQANYAEVSNSETEELLNSDYPPFLLDVRTPGEFRQAYIEGAELIPLQNLQQRLAELEKYKNHPILIYCATGNRSTTAAKILLDNGFKNVKNVRAGIFGWAQDGYPIVR